MRNIPVSKPVKEIIRKEVIARNKKLSPGQPKYTQRIVAEEIIIKWKEDFKNGTHELRKVLNES